MVAIDLPECPPGSVEVRLIGCTAVRRSDGRWLPLFAHEALVLAMVAIDGPQARRTIAARLWHGDDGLVNLRQCLFQLTRRAGTALLFGRSTLTWRADLHSDVDAAFGAAAAALLDGELLGTLALPRLPHAGADWMRQARRRWHGARLAAFEREAALLDAAGEPRAESALLERLLAAAPLHDHLWQRRIAIHARLGDGDGAAAIAARWREIAIAAGRPPVLATARADAVAAPVLAVTALFVGRRDELQRMTQAWARGSHFALVGEAGIGKSALLRHLAAGRSDVVLVDAVHGDAANPHGITTLWLLACSERWGLPPQPGHRAQLARLLPGLAPEPTGTAHPALMQAALLAALQHAAEHGLAALLIDDIDRVDAASLQVVLRCLAAAVGPRVGFAIREPGLPRSADVIGQLLDGHAGLEVVEVGGLSAAEARELVRALRLDRPELEARVPELVAHCGGNPWYLLDTLRALAHGGDLQAPLRVTGSVGRFMDERLSRLSSPARRMAWLAAVAGPEHALPLAPGVLMQSADAAAGAWRELQAARVLRGDAFAHDIVRQAVAREVPAAAAREMHRSIADGAGRVGAPPHRVAHHRACAEQWREAAMAAEAAGERALQLGQRKALLEWLDKAADWYRRAGMPADAQRVATGALLPSAEHEGPARALDRAAGLDASAATPSERAALAAERSRIALKANDADSALRHARAALDAVDRPGHPVAVSVLAVVLAWRGRFAEALGVIEPAIERIAGVADANQRHDLLSSYALVLAHEERWRQAVPVIERALDEARSTGNDAACADMHNSLACAHLSLGRGRAAVEPARRSHALFADMDAIEFARTSHLNLAKAHLACGHYAQAAAILDGLLRAAAADPAPELYASTAENALAELWIAVGKTARARELLVAEPPPQPVLRCLTRLELRARAARQERSPQADALCRQALDAAEILPLTSVRRWHTRLVLGDGRAPDRARHDADRALALADERDSPALAVLARLHRAQALLRGGDAAAARADALQALAAASALQHAWIHPPEVWLTAAACDAAAAPLHRAAGRAWLRRIAAQHLPPGCRDDFLHRHPVHRALLGRPAE